MDPLIFIEEGDKKEPITDPKKEKGKDPVHVSDDEFIWDPLVVVIGSNDSKDGGVKPIVKNE